MPPGAIAYAHIHDGFEVMLYIVKGKVKHAFGEGLTQEVINEAGDFIYIKPGVPLSRAMLARLRPATNVIILGNHGLIVAGDTVAATADLLARVSAALDAPRRPGPAADLGGLAGLAQGSPYRLPSDPVAHDTATDPDSLAIARHGTLYPDHVVFLGRGITLLGKGETPADIAARPDPPPVMLVVPGKGVLLLRSALRGADELARGLADVTGRIAPGTAVRSITADQEDELIEWDAEVYRRKLAAGARPPGA